MSHHHQAIFCLPDCTEGMLNSLSLLKDSVRAHNRANEFIREEDWRKRQLEMTVTISLLDFRLVSFVSVFPDSSPDSLTDTHILPVTSREAESGYSISPIRASAWRHGFGSHSHAVKEIRCICSQERKGKSDKEIRTKERNRNRKR